jgi:hypothetical protein
MDLTGFTARPGEASSAYAETASAFEERTMSLVSLIVVLIIVGLLLWLVNNYIPMDGKIKQILNIVVVIAVILWLLQAFGVLDGLGGIRVGR